MRSRAKKIGRIATETLVNILEGNRTSPDPVRVVLQSDPRRPREHRAAAGTVTRSAEPAKRLRNGPVAQRIEQQPSKLLVGGSIPPGVANKHVICGVTEGTPFMVGNQTSSGESNGFPALSEQYWPADASGERSN